MGREAECRCEFNGQTHKVKALLEPPELILRGELQRRLPYSALEHIRAEGETLRFASGAESFSLLLGSAMAAKWAKSIAAPAPSLAKKLGVSSTTVVRMIGEVDDDALRAALAEAKAVTDNNANLILARIRSTTDLRAALLVAAKELAAGTPIWFIYAKGREHKVSENDVRSMALAAGIVDTKVCSVSPALTALRFVKRKRA